MKLASRWRVHRRWRTKRSSSAVMMEKYIVLERNEDTKILAEKIKRQQRPAKSGRNLRKDDAKMGDRNHGNSCARRSERTDATRAKGQVDHHCSITSRAGS